MGHVVATRLAAIGSGRTVTFILAQVNKADLVALGELLAAGTVTPIVDRRTSSPTSPVRFGTSARDTPRARSSCRSESPPPARQRYWPVATRSMARPPCGSSV